jgi:hypothetical protein
MAMDPEERADKVREVQEQYEDMDTIPIVREYLRYEHAKQQGIQKRHDSPDLREMVDIHYEALRGLLIKRFKTSDRLDRLMARARQHLLKPLYYSNH